MHSTVADAYRDHRLPVYAGTRFTHDPEQARRYKAAGWRPLGASTALGFMFDPPATAAQAAAQALAS